MGKNLLLDTDILIDWLHGQRWVKDLLLLPGYCFYYSAVTRKELLTKPGLSDAERGEVNRLLRHLRYVPLTPDIAEKSFNLLRCYTTRGLQKQDALVAATAWSKKFPLMTRNLKHFEFIREIELVVSSRNTLKSRSN